MANQSGRGVNLPQVNRNSLQRADIPQVRVAASTSGGEALFSIANVLRGVTGRIEDRLDVKAKVEGAREGTLAGQGDTLPELRDDATIRGEAFNNAARESAIMKFDMEGREHLRTLENQYKNNPQGFDKAAGAYFDGVAGQLQGWDPREAQRYQNVFTERKEAYLSRIQTRHEALVRDSQLEDALRFTKTATDDLATRAQGMMRGDPQDVMKNLQSMMAGAADLAAVANRRGPDGAPLFDARQRIAIERNAEEAVAGQIAFAWMDTQTDILTAYETWKDGGAEIAVADENGNTVTMPLRQVLGEANYQRAEGAFMERLRGQLALEAQVSAAEDRAFKATSDVVFTDMMQIAQDGGLDMAKVEQAKSRLEPEKYIALRALARGGGAAVSDGAAMNRLMLDDLAGQDIRPQLVAAYDQGQLSREDFTKLYDRNQSRLESGRPDDLAVGRDFVGNSLGRLSKELGFAQSMSIAQAEAEYETRIENFVEKENRRPSQSEALEIGRDVVRRYSLISMETSLLSLPLPRYMQPGDRIGQNLTDQTILTVGQKTRAAFLKKYGGNVEMMQQDEKYQEEMKLLQEYSKLLKVKNGNAANQ